MAVARTLDRSSAPGWAERAWNRVDTARPRLLDTADLAQVLADSERLISRLHAAQAKLLTELARPVRHDDAAALVEAMTGRGEASKHPDTDTDRRRNADRGGETDPDLTGIEVMVAATARRLAAAEAACALRISPQAAANRVNTALELTTALPATVGALHAGQIDRSTAHMLLDRTAVLPDADRASVEELILPLAGKRSLSRLRTLTDRAVITTDPDAARRRENRAHADRDVNHRPLPEGMGQIIATLPAHGALTVHTLLQHLADANPDRTRTLGARRADALTDLAATLLTTGRLDLRTHHPVTPVTVPGHSDSDSNRPSRERTRVTEDGPTPGSPHSTEADTPNPITPNPITPSQITPSPITPRPITPSPVPPDPQPDPRSPDPRSPDPQPPSPDEPDPQPPDPDLSEPLSPQPTASDRTSPAAPVSTGDLTHRTDETTETAGSFAPPTRQGRPVDLVITLSLSTLAGLDQLPGHLTGHGPITSDYARTLAAAARTITLLALDPVTGTALGISDRTYRPRQRLRDQTLTLNQSCSWPGCTHQSWRCDLDHRDAYDHRNPQNGGPTALHNIDPQCRWHHLLKTHTAWSLDRRPDRTFTITSPSGLAHRDDPPEFTLPDEWNDRRTPPSIAVTTGAPDDSPRIDAVTAMPRSAPRRLVHWSDEHASRHERAAESGSGADHELRDGQVLRTRYESSDDDAPPF